MTGYSGTPLDKKLGIKPGMKTFIHQMPDEVLKQLSEKLNEVELHTKPCPDLYYMHIFCRSRGELEKRLNDWKKHLSKTGCFWISWPKKSSKLKTDLSDAIVRETGLASGLVDVKVCAINEEWSGLKFVYRKEDR